PLLQRCLHKNRKQRLQAIGEARIALNDPHVGQVANLRPIVNRPYWATAAISIVIAAFALWGWLRPRPVDPKPVMRFSVAIPQFNGQVSPIPSLSRDGSMLAYRLDPSKPLYIRRIDQFDAQPVPGTE